MKKEKRKEREILQATRSQIIKSQITQEALSSTVVY
jgi:hypothetical protein